MFLSRIKPENFPNRCFDGYKGSDCSKEDQLVILLKETLIIVSVGLGLMLVVVIAIAVFCIKR